jgi:hypothetical protein
MDVQAHQMPVSWAWKAIVAIGGLGPRNAFLPDTVLQSALVFFALAAKLCLTGHASKRFGSRRHYQYLYLKRRAPGGGTFWLTFAGWGSAVIAAASPEVGIGLVYVSIAGGTC